MRPIEQDIISQIVDRALAKGYMISVFDGEEWAVVKSRDKDRILAETAATDVTQYKIRNAEGENLGSIIFVHGNDEDVIHDYSDTPEIWELLPPC